MTVSVLADVPVWMGERIFAVHALFIRNWPTVFRHRAMVSTCRIHGPIIGHWHSLNLCVFSQWKPRFPHGKTDPVSMSVTWPSFNNQGPVSISDKTSYRKISWSSRVGHLWHLGTIGSRSRSLDATRFVFRIVRSLWNVTGTSAALLAVLPMCLSDSKAIRWFKLLISRLRDFMRSYDKTSYRILKQGLGRGHMWWTPLPGTRLADSWSINCHFVYPEMLSRVYTIGDATRRD